MCQGRRRSELSSPTRAFQKTSHRWKKELDEFRGGNGLTREVLVPWRWSLCLRRTFSPRCVLRQQHPQPPASRLLLDVYGRRGSAEWKQEQRPEEGSGWEIFRQADQCSKHAT